MVIRIKVHGHQHYHEHVGAVLSWCQAVEFFDEKPMQVPAVIIDAGEVGGGKDIQLVTLQRSLYWTEIEVLSR